jgi:DNA-binding transcriptional LysR family regulator
VDTQYSRLLPLSIWQRIRGRKAVTSDPPPTICAFLEDEKFLIAFGAHHSGGVDLAGAGRNGSVEINDAVESIVSNKLANVTGTLRLSAPQNISDTMLTPLVTAFQASYPNVRVHILIAERFVDHIADGVDIVFRLGALKDSSLVARKILTYRHQLVASPDYLKGREAPEMPQDLLRHRLLSFSYSDLDVISAVLLITGPQLGHRLMSQKGQHQTSCRLPSALRSNVKDPILRRANMRNSLGVTPAERSDGDQHRKAEIHSSFGAALTNATGDI